MLLRQPPLFGERRRGAVPLRAADAPRTVCVAARSATVLCQGPGVAVVSVGQWEKTSQRVCEPLAPTFPVARQRCVC